MIRNPIPWPGGARCACAITFDVDADSLIHISRPTDGHNRLYPISMGRYGPNVGVARILETYRRLGLKQSFFMPGWVMERYPSTVEKILENGHEIGHHGYLHEDATEQSEPEQTYWFERALDVHKRMTGRVPRGYRAPVYNATPTIIDLAIRHGLAYDSSLMADDIPYVLESPAGRLFELPVHWGSDDWPPFAHYAEIGYMMPVMAPRRGLEASFEEFEAQYEAGGLWIGIWHPFLTGRLARWRVVERWLETVLAGRKVWFAPLEDIAAYVAGLEARSAWAPDVEPVTPYRRPVLLETGACEESASLGPAHVDEQPQPAKTLLALAGRIEPDRPYLIPARQGRAVRVRAGEVIRIINTYGRQVGDFWAFAAADPSEFLSMEHVRPSLRRITLRPGDPLVTNQRRPILTLLEDTSPGVHDMLVASCDVHRYHQLGHEGYHDNCTDNLRAALAAIGVRISQVPCPLNLWMNTPLREGGVMDWLAPVSRPGDFVRLRAEIDALVVVSCCPMDLLPINGEDACPKSLGIILEGAGYSEA